MGILEDYKNREAERIERFFGKAEMLTEGQIDEIISFLFKTFYDQGPAGQVAAKALILKINKVLGIKYVPGKGEFEKWNAEFKTMKPDIKRSLLVTVANDLCRMNIFTESQITAKVDFFLNDIPGILAGTRDIQ